MLVAFRCLLSCTSSIRNIEICIKGKHVIIVQYLGYRGNGKSVWDWKGRDKKAKGGVTEDINLRSFLIKGAPLGNGGNLGLFFVLEMKKSRSRSRYAYYAVTSHSTKYGWLHQNFINLLLLRFYIGNTNLIFLTIYYLRNDDIFKQLILLNFTLTKFTQKLSFHNKVIDSQCVTNISWIMDINNWI